VIVLDSEGIGGIEKDQDYDLKIFSLMVLATSVLMYNSIGAIDEETLSSMSLMAELTRYIQT